MNWGKLSALGLMAVTVLMFQNCSKIATSDLSDPLNKSANGNVSGDDDDLSNFPPTGPDPGDGSSYTSDDKCKKALSTNIPIAYETIPDTGAVVKDFRISEAKGGLSYEHIGTLSNGAITKLNVQARTIQTVRSFASSRVTLNAMTIDTISNFASSGVVVSAKEIKEVSSFAATFCANTQKLDSLHNLAAKLSVYGRKEGGKLAEIQEVRNLAAFFSFHDVHIAELSNGALSGRFENSVIDKISSASGTIYLVNSSIGDISNFAGTVYLIGNSTVGSSSASVRIVKR